MTEEEIRAIADGTKAYVEAEFNRLATPVIRQEERTTELEHRVETLATKLAGVTTALVEADGAMLQRIDQIEQVLGTFHRGGDPDETFDLIEEYLDEPEPRPEPKPVDTTPRIIRALRKRPGVMARVTRSTSTHQGAVPEGDE